MDTNRIKLHESFQTISGSEYLFDGPTGAVFPTNALLREAIALYETQPADEVREQLKAKYPPPEVDGAIDFVERWEEHFHGFFGSDEETETLQCQANSYSENDIRSGMLASGLPIQLILNVTENCNFRCKYCYLTEAYEFTRNRTSKRMTPAVGIKALDYFFDVVRPIAKRIPGKIIAITFYGGEPLLEASLLMQLIDYARTHSPLRIVYNLTTNGSLLTDELMGFLVENDVHFVISLDGTKENHDRNRKFPNGEGTFDVVFENIKRFKERYPDYWMMRTIAVYDWKTDLEANVKFFEEHDLSLLFTNEASHQNTTYWDRFTEEDRIRFRKQFRRMVKLFYDLKSQGKAAPRFLRTLLSPIVTEGLFRPRHGNARNPLIPFTNNCVPGMKISVRTDGTFDMCERINEKFPIGHLSTGLDYGKIRETIRSYNSSVINRNCGRCAFNKNCPLCFAQCCGNCQFQRPFSNWCESFRDRMAESLSIVYSILESEPTAFDYLKTLVKSNEYIDDILFRM